MKEKITAALAKITNLKKEEIENLIEIPPDSSLGDYAFPCFILSKSLKKSPNEISLSLSKKISPSREIEKVQSLGPYINFFLNKNILAELTIKKILEEKEKYGSSKKNKEKVMVEFSQANTHKAFHIGHIRGTSLGESIARILESQGNKVIRANYQGDTGMHVAKWIWCYKKYHSHEDPKADESWIASIYVGAVKKISENPEFQSEVDEINRRLESKEDKSLNELWKKTKKLSLDSFKPIYEELNTKFDNYFFESEVEKRGKEISLELVQKGIAKKSEGATIIDLKKFNLGIWVLLRKDGTVLYSAKDLALAEKKFNQFKIEKSIHIVGSAQQLHFSQLFKTLELMKFKQAKNCKYIPVTEVRLPQGKMSSRTGENIIYSQFQKEIIACAEAEIKKRYPKLSKAEIERRSLAIAIASLKYAMLKQDVNKTIVFVKEEATNFEGNTGPYLLYTYARAKSILRKALYNSKKQYKTIEITDKEKQLISKLSSFPEIVSRAYNSLAPNLIANYAYELSQIFNEFYHAEKVLGSENEQFKLTLVDAFSQVLKNSLNLLGISVLEQM